jgi:RHS repeat-associated protein
MLDSQSRRVGKRVNGIMTRMYIYQSQTQIAAELDGQGRLINRYVYGTKANSPDYVVSNDHVIKVVSDQVGTPRAFIDAVTGAIISKTHFDEFGIKSKPAATSASELDSIGFAGGLFDADTGLTHFGAREYNAETGKWLSKDPIGFSGGDTNLYGYVANDPVNYIDPEGNNAIAPAIFIGAVIVGAAISIDNIYNYYFPPPIIPGLPSGPDIIDPRSPGKGGGNGKKKFVCEN